MNIAQAMNFKELHLAILRILVQNQHGFTPKEIIARFALNYREAYYPTYNSGNETKITDAKIYGALKFLEKEKAISKKPFTNEYEERSVPRYIISDIGKDLIKHSVTLSIQNLLSTVIITFLQKQLDKFPLFDISFHDASLGLIGPSLPIGYSILTFIKETIESFDPLTKTNPIYFMNIDQILQNLYNPPSQEDIDKSLTPSIQNTIYRSCDYDNNKFRIDMGNHKLDLVFSVLLFTLFPNNVDSLLDEIYRILKPGGMVIIQEQNFYNVVFPWVLEVIPQEEQRLISDIFVHILEQARKGIILDLSILKTKIQDKFGSILRTDEFGEIKILYVRKNV